MDAILDSPNIGPTAAMTATLPAISTTMARMTCGQAVGWLGGWAISSLTVGRVGSWPQKQRALQKALAPPPSLMLMPPW